MKIHSHLVEIANLDQQQDENDRHCEARSNLILVKITNLDQQQDKNDRHCEARSNLFIRLLTDEMLAQVGRRKPSLATMKTRRSGRHFAFHRLRILRYTQDDSVKLR
ncbi:hypothetical protein [Pedobacter endophyticus]|uniref:Uncharacterized protein n=1 Tax=Pedobacter endophyticus TaxID=2789740 RepID=A0A7S9L0N5_9SPHI|nr:hypothetical protein [Pedobacter endophyticus]QPH40315.1 hypothetical protein IZT61_03280 [Pedobacter endophyticus]